MVIERFLISETQTGFLIVKLQLKSWYLQNVSPNELAFLNARIYFPLSLYPETMTNFYALHVILCH
jgi:hypothetical protein